MRITHWLTGLIACAIASLVALALYSRVQTGEIYRTAAYASENSLPSIVVLNELRTHVTRMRVLIYRHLVTRELAGKKLLEDRIHQELTFANGALRKYTHQATDQSDHALIAEEERLLNGYERALDEILSESRAGSTSLAGNNLLIQAEIADKLEEVLDRHIGFNVQQGKKGRQAAEKNFNESMLTMAVFTLAIIGAMLWISIMIVRAVKRQIDETTALANDNALYRAMVEGSASECVLLHDHDKDSLIIHANATACRHFEADLQTLLSWRPRDFDLRTDPAKLRSIDEALSTHGHVTFETEHRTASGAIIPVEVSINHFSHAGKNLSIGYIRDLRLQLASQTQALQLQRLEAEQESLRKLSRIEQSAPGLMYIMTWRNDRPAMIYLSPAIADLFGLTSEEALGDFTRLVALVLPEDREKLKAASQASRRDLSPYQCEYRIQHPSKGIRWLEARSIPDRLEDGSLEWHGFITDITDRKRLETALATREQTFRTLAENSPDMIIRYNLDYRRVYVNQAFLKNWGAAPKDVLDTRVTETGWWSTNITAEEYEQILRTVVETGKPTEVRFFGALPAVGGQPRHTMATVVPEYDANGEVSSLLSVVRDISEIISVEAELRKREQYQRALLDNFPFFVWLKDRDSRLLAVNLEYARVTHCTNPQDLVGKTDFEIFPHDLARQYVEDDQAVLASGTPKNLVEQYLDDKGELRWMETYKSPVVVNSVTVGTVGFARDVTDQMRTQLALSHRERELSTLIGNSPDTLIRYDLECRRIYISKNYPEVYGNAIEEALGKKPTESWGKPMMKPEEYEHRLMGVITSAQTEDIDLDWYDEHGEYVCQSLRAVPEFDSTGRICSVLTISRDVSELKRTASRLKASEQQFRALVENTPDTVARYDRECRRIYANPSMIEESGVGLAQLLDVRPEQFPGGDQAVAYQTEIVKVLETGQPSHFEQHWKTGDGDQICSHIRLTPEFGMDGQVEHVLAVGRDITEIDAYRKQIHNMAFYDGLTNLPNRSLLLDRIHTAIADAAWHGTQFGLMMLDLDRFKEVNDTLGHGVGDLLLREVAQRLNNSIRAYDTVARLGGDEFAILLPEIRQGNDLSTVARKILSAFEQPFQLAGRELFISTSVGIALYPGDSAEIDALFKYADSAMYHAKKLGRNNFQFYSRELTARSSERMQLEAALRRAIKHNELELYYQPQVDLATGEVIGSEALLRWNRKEGMVTPDRFIPIAEETGLIVGIGEWALLNACQAVTRWNRSRENPLRVAVNLSTRQFIQNDLVATVRATLIETECKPEWLKLEITESLLLDDSSHVLDMLNSFNEMGLAIAIDDFGTGYSALSYLNRFPVSQIKIDRSFVRDIAHQRDKAELVKAMISIAQALNLELIAEGVESADQASYLLAHGCRIAQGFLYGKPMPAAAFEQYLDSTAAVLQ